MSTGFYYIRNAVIAAGAIGFIIALLTTTGAYAQEVRPVRWYFDVAPVGDREAVITFTADLDEGWQICSQFVGEDAAKLLPTTFSFFPDDTYQLLGKVKEESRPARYCTKKLMTTTCWYTRVAVFTQRVKLHAPSAVVRGRVEFMTCMNDVCLPPDVAPFTLAVKGLDVEVNNMDYRN